MPETEKKEPIVFIYPRTVELCRRGLVNETAIAQMTPELVAKIVRK